MKTLSCSIIGLLIISLPAAAQPAGNLPADFYPRGNCVRPDISKVDNLDYHQTLRYNRMIKDYNACGKTYLANAHSDAEYVLAMINAQVAKVNGEAAPAIPSTPGNLPAGFYPASTCVRPDKAAIGTMPSTQKVPVIAATGKPQSAEGQQAVDSMAAYNQRVTRYNLDVAAFGDCSKDYIAKGRADLARIQAASAD
jgi:hypothetical protein